MNDRSQLVSKVNAPEMSPDNRGADSVAFEQSREESSALENLQAIIEEGRMQDQARLEMWRASPYNLR